MRGRLTEEVKHETGKEGETAGWKKALTWEVKKERRLSRRKTAYPRDHNKKHWRWGKSLGGEK